MIQWFGSLLRAWFVTLLACVGCSAAAQPTIQHYDFSQSTPFKATVLRGTWGFAWDQHLTPQKAYDAFADGSLRAIPVPNRWHELLPEDPDNPYLHGIASYVIHVTLPQVHMDVPVLHLDVVTEAYRAYWIPLNDPRSPMLIGEEGALSGPSVAAIRNQSLPITAEGEGLILLQVRKDIFSWGEVDRIPTLTTARQDVATRQSIDLMEGFWLGALTFAMLSNLMLFVMRREDPSALFLALALASVISRFIATADLLENTFGPEWHVLRMRIELGGMVAMGPLALATNQYLLPPFVNKRLFTAAVWSGVLMGAFVAFAPPEPMTAALPVYQVFVLVVAGIGIFGLVRAALQKRPGAALLLFAVLTIVAAAIHDIASVIIPAYERNLIAAGLMVFVFVYTFVVGRRVTDALSRTRLLERDKRHLQRLHSEAIDSARHDHLTGLLNRKAFDQDVEAFCLAASTEAAPISLMLFDIDHFKKINDTHGHPVGDIVLRHLGEALATSGARKNDRFYRYGGEEFALILSGADGGRATQIAEHLRREIAGLSVDGPNGVILRITCSFGVATSTSSSATPSTLLQAADDALYVAKHAGRDRVNSSSADHAAKSNAA